MKYPQEKLLLAYVYYMSEFIWLFQIFFFRKWSFMALWLPPVADPCLRAWKDITITLDRFLRLANRYCRLAHQFVNTFMKLDNGCFGIKELPLEGDEGGLVKDWHRLILASRGMWLVGGWRVEPHIVRPVPNLPTNGARDRFPTGICLHDCKVFQNTKL